MSLPSSPPREEFDFPSSPSFLLPARKRQLTETEADASDHHHHRADNVYDTGLSSDPLFSDEPSESDDQSRYDRPRRKKMIRAPWWKLGATNRPKRMRQPASGNEEDPLRNFDSGVFMGSDQSEGSIDGLLSAHGKRSQPRRVPIRRTAQVSPQSIARQILDERLDAGKEVIDLSGLGLDSLSPDTLTPLRHCVRLSHNHLAYPPSEDEFTALIPSIQLFLAHNQLFTLPAELFRIENLTVLSLRNNELTELPPAIAQLKRLQELNVAGNSIRFLPWELMDILDCRETHKQITLRPNPLIAPTPVSGPPQLNRLQVVTKIGPGELSCWKDVKASYDGVRQQCLEAGILDIRTEMELRLRLGHQRRTLLMQKTFRAGQRLSPRSESLIYLASSNVRLFEADGTPCISTLAADETYAVCMAADDGDCPPRRDSPAPSLFELALRTVQSHYFLETIPSGMPAAVAVAMEKAATCVEFGNPRCSTCERAFVVHRAEWMEYWFHGFASQKELAQDAILPFLRRVCSWACATPTEPGTFRH